MGRLLIDLGGTKTLAAKIDSAGKIEKTIKLSTASFKDEVELLNSIFQHLGFSSSIYLAAAGPIQRGVLRVTHFGWVIDVEKIKKQMGVKECYLFNDLVAMGWSLDFLTSQDLVLLHGGIEAPSALKLLIAPGTGLGVSFGFEKKWYPSEGGHMDFAPTDQHQYEILLFFQKKYGHVSFERLLGGSGFSDLLAFYTDEHEVGPKTITQRAKDRSCPSCVKVIEDYVSILSSFIANAALFVIPRGGIYLGGGIVPHIDLFLKEKITKTFQEKGRVSYLLEKIPLSLITNENSVILGLMHIAKSD